MEWSCFTKIRTFYNGSDVKYAPSSHCAPIGVKRDDDGDNDIIVKAKIKTDFSLHNSLKYVLAF